MSIEPTYSLTIDPVAMEKCFIVSKLLSQLYQAEKAEYGLLGLALQSNPLHVVEVLLLPGQRVNAVSVFQSGHNVVRMAKEIDVLSQEAGEPLVAITFVHRHPEGVAMSMVDTEFLAGVFVDQVSTLISFRESTVVKSGEFPCDCLRTDPFASQPVAGIRPDTEVEIEFGLCFSIIVNSHREYSITAVRKAWCPFCGTPAVHLMPAGLSMKPKRTLTQRERIRLREQLSKEIKAKVQLDSNVVVSGEIL